MSNLFADLQVIVNKLLSPPPVGYGFEVTLLRAPPAYDLVEGTPTGLVVNETHSVITSKNAGQLMSDVRMVGNASIMTTDVCLLFKPDVDVKDDDHVLYLGYEWGCLAGGLIAPGGVRLLQKVWLRR